MKIVLAFSQSFYNCDVVIHDGRGTQKHDVNLAESGEDGIETLEAEVFDGNFDLTVIPKMADYKAIHSEMEIENWKDRLAKKLGNALFSVVDCTLLRVGCKYRVSGLKENDTVHVCGREYLCGTFDRFELLDLLPVMYMVFEASCNGRRFELLDAFGVNRREVVSSARKIALLDFGLQMIVTYPIQVGRVKRLTSDKKVRKTLIKFSQMGEAQRQKRIDKMEKHMG